MEDNRLLDRSNYSRETIECFEIMSAYYVDMIYNSLYKEAKKLKASNTVPSITEGYKHTLNAFLQSLDNNRLYKKSVVGIHHYFLAIGFGTISFQKCLDKLVAEFVPVDYFASLSSQQKMGVLRLVLNQSLKMLVKKIVQEHLSKIIDYHKEKDNARLLQDELIDCFIIAREGMFQRFIKTQTKVNKNENVNRALAERMQTEIKKLMAEKYKHLKHIKVLSQAYAKQKELYNKQTSDMAEIRNKIGILTGQLAAAKLASTASSEPVIGRRSIYEPTPVAPEPVVHSAPVTQSTVVPSRLEPAAQSALVAPEPVYEHIAPSMSTPVEPVAEVDESDDESAFVEVTDANMDTIINGDNEYIQNMKDSDSFSIHMNSGTTLDDFS